MTTKKQVKPKRGAKPKPFKDKKFRIEVWVSPSEIGQDNGVKTYLAAMHRELDKQIAKHKKANGNK